MKRKFIVIVFAASLSWTACDQSETESTTVDSTANAELSTTTNNESSATFNSSFDENASYMNLRDNKPVKVKKDANAGYLVDAETNQPFSYFFYNPATRDTFNQYGYVVNTYLIRGNDGMYTLDEERWRTKVDEDGDIKMKDGDESKIKYDASSGQTKIKTEDTVIKKQ